MEWIIAYDQPFKEVERPEFVMMMNYTYHTGTPLKIPKCNGIVGSKSIAMFGSFGLLVM